MDTDNILSNEEFTKVMKSIYNLDVFEIDSSMYFLNTDYLKFQHLNNPLFTRGDTQRVINQLAYITPIYLYGNLTINSARVHGVMKD